MGAKPVCTTSSFTENMKTLCKKRSINWRSPGVPRARETNLR